MARPLEICRLTGALVVLMAGIFPAASFAAAPAPSAHAPCFSLMQWQGWKAPRPDVLYLKVNSHDVYEADLSAGSAQLQWPDAHLVSLTRGQDSICTPADLRLAVVGLGGYREPLVVSHLTLLTPEEVAAIPERFRPH
jgi:hypothetical protein